MCASALRARLRLVSWSALPLEKYYTSIDTSIVLIISIVQYPASFSPRAVYGGWCVTSDRCAGGGERWRPRQRTERQGEKPEEQQNMSTLGTRQGTRSRSREITHARRSSGAEGYLSQPTPAPNPLMLTPGMLRTDRHPPLLTEHRETETPPPGC